MNETYQEYINRIARLTLPTSCSVQLNTIQKSPKFDKGEAMPFPGYSVITPPSKEDADNQKFYKQIEFIQKNIVKQLEPGLVVPLDPESFHFTIADLIWDNSYQQAVKDNPQFETQLQEQINHSFEQYRANKNGKSEIKWQLLGVNIRPRAIMACLAPQDQESYQAIVDLRSCIYQSTALIGLGVQQQYDFTAHVTIGYFDSISPDLNRSEICVIISQISDRLLESEPTVITVNRVELRKFENMIDYHRQPDWAAISF